MSFANPTPLRLGLTGVLAGKRYRVAGRVVMSMDADGETYYWNEYHLVNDAGETATLVFEETENGPEWRLFTLIEPPPAITAAEARAKRVGDPVTLEGQTARVTLVDQSRVAHIEGVAPEGVESGDRADYFNVGAGHRLWVVSWTGDEVECYRGVTVPAALIERGFAVKLPVATTAARPGLFTALSSGGSQRSPGSGKLVFLAAMVILFLLRFSSCGSSRPAARREDMPRTIPLPATSLAVGATGRLGERHYRIAGHTVREARRSGLVFSWHEFHLMDDNNAGELLVLGLNPGQRSWLLFTPARADAPFTPQQAAARRLGDRLRVNGLEVTVTDLFLSAARAGEGEPLPGLRRDGTRYHFRAESPGTPVLASWDDTGLELQRGWTFTDAQVTAAFDTRPAVK